jgi:hypothetical protein
LPVDKVERQGVDAAVAYVQDGSRDKPGAMLGAAYTGLTDSTKESSLH